MGRAEFEEWSNRIISGAMIDADVDSQKFALCGMLMTLPATEHMKPDIHFISQLRKVSVNQTAHTIGQELHAKVKEREKKENEEKEISKIDEVANQTLERAKLNGLPRDEKVQTITN